MRELRVSDSEVLDLQGARTQRNNKVKFRRLDQQSSKRSLPSQLRWKRLHPLTPPTASLLSTVAARTDSPRGARPKLPGGTTSPMKPRVAGGDDEALADWQYGAGRAGLLRVEGRGEGRGEQRRIDGHAPSPAAPSPPLSAASSGSPVRGPEREDGEDVRLSVQAAADRRFGGGQDLPSVPLLRGRL
ncbi:ras-related protein Rab-8B isoform X1 [Cebus imitator]|uniref:ras-related protein Rab-8B isoform X1 n=1 Tax=Cebus imitator TaxID=2715852 RepID=UPI001896D032|nr:ras-related protein Rab-8B isoform X1 [Cebus imitator]